MVVTDGLRADLDGHISEPCQQPVLAPSGSTYPELGFKAARLQRGLAYGDTKVPDLPVRDMGTLLDNFWHSVVICPKLAISGHIGPALNMSALPPKADMARRHGRCPLMTHSGHSEGWSVSVVTFS